MQSYLGIIIFSLARVGWGYIRRQTQHCQCHFDYHNNCYTIL